MESAASSTNRRSPVYICLCHGITERAIREAAASGVRDLSALKAQTGCAGTCGCCAELAAQLLAETAAETHGCINPALRIAA